jgi:hypothetical protein
MSATLQAPNLSEIARITEEYRRLGFEHDSPAVVVYHDPYRDCPWLDCEQRIIGVDFHLDQLGDKALRDRLHRAWWRGPGLVGPCPRCKRLVLFALQEKQAIADPSAYEEARLPDDWAVKAFLSPKLK